MNRKPCPSCREEGRDTSGNNLTLNAKTKWWNCYACGYSEPPSGRTKEMTARKSKMTLEECNVLKTGHDPDRKVHADAVKAYGIRFECSTTDGKLEKIFYPYYSGEDVVAYKARNTRTKDFFWVGKTDVGLYGKQRCKPSERPRLLIVEGEEDLLAAVTNLRTGIPAGKGVYDVVSLPDGAGINSKVKEEIDFMSKYERVYLYLDQDKPGQKAEDELADFISSETEVYRVSTPMYKDASDLHTAGDNLRSFLASAEQYEPEGVVNGVDIELSDLLEPMEEGYLIPFTGLQDKLHGARKGEITTVCAGSGIGKSTLVREISLALTEQGLSVANVALEDQMKVAAQALIALKMDIPLATFRFSPPPEADVKPVYDEVIANNKTFFYKHFGGLNQASLINRLRYYAKSKQCDFIILDHLSMVISNSKSSNERKDIDTLMTDLAKLVVETGVGIIQIVHLKRKGDGTSYAHGGEVELSDLRGSAALEQLSWNVIGLERDQQGDDRNFSKIRVLKNRLFGFTGLADTVHFEPTTGRMTSVAPVVPEITEELPSEEDEDD